MPYVLLFLICLAVSGSLIPFVIKDLFDIFQRNLGLTMVFNIIQAFAVSYLVVAPIYLLVYSAINMLSPSEKTRTAASKILLRKSWFLLAVMMSLIFFVAGCYIIDQNIGSRDLILRLNDDYHLYNNTIIPLGMVRCYGDRINPGMVAGSLVTCNVEGVNSDIQLKQGKITFIYQNSPQYALNISKEKISNFSFMTARDVNLTYISFFYEGLNNSNNMSVNLSSGTPYSFPTQVEQDEKNKIFISYFIALFVIILITVPSAILNIKNLYDAKDK